MKPRVDILSGWTKPFLALVFLAMLAGGVWFYLEQKEAMRLEVERNLTAIAHLKADQIAAWRNDQLHDAAILQGDPFIRASVAHFLADPSEEHRQDLLLRFRSLADQHDFDDIVLVEPDGKERLSLTGGSRATTTGMCRPWSRHCKNVSPSLLTCTRKRSIKHHTAPW